MSNGKDVPSQSTGNKRAALSSDENDIPQIATRVSLDDVQGVVDQALDKQQKGMQGLLKKLSEGMESLSNETREHTQSCFKELGTRVSGLEAAQRKQEAINEEVKQELQGLKDRSAEL